MPTEPQFSGTSIAWLPDLLYTGDRFQRDLALVCNTQGLIVKLCPAAELRDEKQVRLAGRAILPGMINSHSHAFQRVLRGRTEYRTSPDSSGGALLPAGPSASPAPNGEERDSFWTWREMMYSAATRLAPEDIYDASRMAFMEMALGGITAVGEFHYLHHAPDGKPYDDPNLLSKEVIRAANDVGLRIALLRVAYVRSGFQTEPNPRQARFIESDPEKYLSSLARLIDELSPGRSPGTSWVGVAPHSVRAVPLSYLRDVIEFASRRNLKVHMHVAEQPAEVSACVAEYGRSPVALLDTEGLLNEHFTAVHAIHVTPKAIASFAGTGAMVCACPTTERNLGDGVVPADQYLKHGVKICLGTDSHAQVDLFEDARELEYHLRLQKLERVLFRAESPSAGNSAGETGTSALAARLFDCATANGARSIGAPSGALETGKPADFFTVDLNDPAIAGASIADLLSSIIFSASRAAVREVFVGGKPIVSEGQHLLQEDVVEKFNELQKRLWNQS
jgi:formimidoylglutamate deiminase